MTATALENRLTQALLQNGIVPSDKLLGDLCAAIRPKREPTQAQKWVCEICAVTGWDVGVNAPRAAKLGKALAAAGGTVDELTAHYGTNVNGQQWQWYRDDWRGQKGQRPNEHGIRETWGAWHRSCLRSAATDALDAFVEEHRDQPG